MRDDRATKTMKKEPAAASAAAAPSVGEVLDGRYRVERALGRGGMGVVLLVTHEHLQTRHAMKLLLDDAWRTPELRDRFMLEARAAARLQSRHVARTSDFGFLPSGAPYMVMEYLEGGDLGTLGDSKEAIGAPDVVRWVIHACDALSEAHRLGIVHRDIKPANLFLTSDEDGRPIVKVVDFGIAKVPREDAAPETGTNVFFGSMQYVSPEQIRSTKNVDARADVWSLGVTLYRLLTKRLPFEAPAGQQTLAMILEDEPLPPSQIRADVPPGLDQVVMRCLVKRREDRMPDVAALARALLPFAPKGMDEQVERIEARLGSRASEPHAEVASPAVGTLQDQGSVRSWGGAAPQKRPRSSWWIAGVAAATVILGAAVWGSSRETPLGTGANAPHGEDRSAATAPGTTSVPVVPSVLRVQPSAVSEAPDAGAPDAARDPAARDASTPARGPTRRAPASDDGFQ